MFGAESRPTQRVYKDSASACPDSCIIVRTGRKPGSPPTLPNAKGQRLNVRHTFHVAERTKFIRPHRGLVGCSGQSGDKYGNDAGEDKGQFLLRSNLRSPFSQLIHMETIKRRSFANWRDISRTSIPSSQGGKVDRRLSYVHGS